MEDRDSAAGRDSSPDPGGRLDSWKEIATYLNRGVRTVIRWEQEERLPSPPPPT